MIQCNGGNVGRHSSRNVLDVYKRQNMLRYMEPKAAINGMEWGEQAQHDNYASTDADIDGKRMERRMQKPIQGKPEWSHDQSVECTEDWERQSNIFEPKLLRNYHGVPGAVDRIKCLGNAVVPQQFYPIFKGIAEIELESKTLYRCKEGAK